jgi:glutamate/tyrosine decarboxylase-like PLP-dependent enzyme
MPTDPPPGLPDRGRVWREIEQELAAAETEHAPHRQGMMDRYWPVYRSDAYLGARDALARFAYANAYSMPDLPGIARMEAGVRAAVGDVLHLPAGGAVTLTGGGTESNFLAVKGARTLARRRGVVRPNLVGPETAHPSIEKATDELGLEMRRVPCAPGFRADPGAIAAAVDDDTALVAVSAPGYTHGVVDPVSEVAEALDGRDVWLHVDACIGGFLVPFLRELGEPLPEFRFDVPSVSSVSVDLHKFGACLHGISALAVRATDLQEAHTYRLPDRAWPYRPYARVGFAGSRPAGVIAAAWVTLQILGRDGYRDLADGVRRAGRRLQDRVARIEGLAMSVPIEAGVAVVVATDGTDVGKVSAALLERGWDIITALHPPALHFLLDPVDDDLVDAFCDDLADALERVRRGEVTASREGQYGD